MTDNNRVSGPMGGTLSEKDCRAILDQAPMGVARFDKEGRYLYANPANVRLLGLEAQAWLGKAEEELGLPAEWLAGWRAAWQQVVETAQGTQAALDLPAADGARRCELTVVPEKGADGAVVAVARYLRDVTARKQADDRRAFLSIVLDSMADEVWFADTALNFAAANRAATEELNQQRAAHAFRSLPQWEDLGILTSDGRPRPVEGAPLLRSLQGEVVHNEGEIARHPQTGEPRYRQVSSAPVHDAEGHIIGAVAVIRDVTEQERARRALQESEERLRALYEQAAVGIKQVDLGGCILNANQKLADILGYTREELAGRSLAGLTLPDDWHAEQDLQARLLAGNIPSYTLEKRYIRKGGREIWARVTTSLARGARQPYYITVVEDIGERKEAEREREEALEKQQLAAAELEIQNEQLIEARGNLEEERRRYRDLFEFAPDGYVVTGQDGVILEANRAAGNLLGRRAEQLAGRRLENYLGTGRPADLSWLMRGLQRRGRVDDQQVMLRPGAHTDGPQPLPVSVTAVAMRDGRGEIARVRWMIRDIRERVAAEQSLRESERRLLELNETLEQRVAERTVQLRALAAALSQAEENERRRLARVLHDHLQQLLVAARLNLNGLQRRLEGDQLASITERIDGVLGEAIDISRSLTAELSPPVLYDAGLTAALRWLARWMEEKHGLQVRVVAEEVGTESPEGVRAMTFQAARELLFNVVKHAGVKEAQVDLRTSDNVIELTVSDRGVGFDPSQIGRKPEGGFGLFSIRERLELLGGRMQVESGPEQGTRVALRVPLRQAEGEEAVAAAEEAALRLVGGGHAREAAPKGGPHPVRVLLVDDHVIVREGLARLLEDEPGIELVGEASDGRQAVALAQMAHPDVVLMDVSMPVMDGVEATRLILKAAPDIKVIGLSMHEKGEIAQRMREAGAVDYIPKGSDPAGLLRAVLRWVPEK